MSINTYSISAEGNVFLSPHFQVKEFAAAGSDKVLIDTALVDMLENIYAQLELSKMIITSGFRTTTTGSFHEKGQAADLNCWRGAVRLQGPEILCAAEVCGAAGIGWIAGSATSRAGVHIDTRPSRYWFDEAQNDKSIQSLQGVSSWWDFNMGAVFNALKPARAETPVSTSLPPNIYPLPVRLLRSGDTGDDVKWLQAALNAVLNGAAGAVDGIFGLKTEAAVRAFQQSHGLAVDGIAGPLTLGALYAAPTVTGAAVIYTVQQGDTLSAIAQRFTGAGSRWGELYNLPENKVVIGDNPNLLQIGQRLTLPAEWGGGS